MKAEDEAIRMVGVVDAVLVPSAVCDGRPCPQPEWHTVTAQEYQSGGSEYAGDAVGSARLRCGAAFRV